jgi:hypothetical protein
MKRRLRPPLRLIAAGALALLAMLIVALSVNRYRAPPPPAAPAALDRIAEKNRRAAIVVAARQRAEAAANRNAANGLIEAQQRGEAAADATLARFPDGDNRSAAARGR